MEVWAIVFDTKAVDSYKELYHTALPLLNEESKEQVERYYHFVDSFRGLVGRLLIRKLLRDRGLHVQSMSFGATSARKPYIIASSLSEPIGYNITHDNGVVAMAFSSGPDLYPDPPAYRIGIDVMLLQLPKRLSYADFVESVSDQLTAHEREFLHLAERLDQKEALRRFYLIWTLKEAYTKALGLGLGFDFRRIEYDVPHDIVRIDGVAPSGWQFVRFDLQRGNDTYVGVVTRYVDPSKSDWSGCVVEYSTADGWIHIHEASDFLKIAIQALTT